MGVIGGIVGAGLALIIVYALDPAPGGPGEVAPSSGAAVKTPVSKRGGAFLCPSCGSEGRPHGDLYLCSNPTCNQEFFEFETRPGKSPDVASAS